MPFGRANYLYKRRLDQTTDEPNSLKCLKLNMFRSAQPTPFTQPINEDTNK